MISSLVSSSRFPVGSSASRTFGSLTRALAMATRCCWPPDSSDGRCRARSARPTSASACSGPGPPLCRRDVQRHERRLHVLLRAERRHQVERLEDEADRLGPHLGDLALAHLRQVGARFGHRTGCSRTSAGPARPASAAGSTCRGRSDPEWRAIRRPRSPGRRPAARHHAAALLVVLLHAGQLVHDDSPWMAADRPQCRTRFGRGRGALIRPSPAPRRAGAWPPASRRTRRRSGRPRWPAARPRRWRRP